MNHLEASFKGKNNIWRYVVMIVLVMLASNTVGSFPLLISMVIKSTSNPGLFSQFAASSNDYGVLGFDSNYLLVMMLLPFVAGLIAFALLIKPLNNRTMKETINGTSKIRWYRFFISAFLWLILSAVYLFVYLKIDPANFSLNNTSGSLIALALIALMLIPFQATFEEVLFRAYLMQGFAVVLRNRWFPLIMTSVLFGLMHSFNPEVRELGFLTMMPQYIIFGLIFGIITIMDDGIEAAMGAHTANNVFLSVMVTNKSSALQTAALYEQHSIYPWTEFTGLLVTGIIFIFLLALLFRWKKISTLFEKIPVQ
jgi:membrane protease YdiL (CAAX protease family)